MFLRYIGVDPFAIYRALDAQLALGLVKTEDMVSYYRVRIDKKDPYCMGSNGFCFRKDLMNIVRDYVQDVEFIARITKAGILQKAISNEEKGKHNF